MSRECGFPAWRLFGLEYFSLVGVGASGVGPYVVRNPNHFLFREPIDLKLREGDQLGQHPGRALPQPIGHEGDVRVSTLAKFQVEPPPPGMAQPTEDPSGITLLADGFADWKKVSIGEPWDYFQRPVPAGEDAAYSGRRRDDLLAAARRRPRVSQWIDQFGIDARGRPEVERPSEERTGSFRRAAALIFELVDLWNHDRAQLAIRPRQARRRRCCS